MSYQFKLEALRRYRRFQEEAMQKELSEVRRQLEKEQTRLSRLIEQQLGTEAELKQQQTQSTTSPHLSIYNDYLRRLAADIVVQRRECDRAAGVYEQKRQALVLAMQKRKTLEKLKENGLKAYLQSLNQEEQKFINEMAISRFILNPK